MALSTYLYTTPGKEDGKTLYNGITHMLYTIDPAVSATTALRKASAMVELRVVTGLAMPDVDYFTTEVLIGAAAGGRYPALDDLSYWTDWEQVESIA